MNRDSDTIIVLSLVKSLGYDTPPRTKTHTLSDFTERSAELVDVFCKPLPVQIGTFMYISGPLAALNVTRYADWSPEFTAENSKQAVLAFDGDAYGRLNANLLAVDDLQFVQKHLWIPLGLYGVLHPLDQIQPCRLEMGTRLTNLRGKDLYAFWGDEVAPALNRLLKQGDDAVFVNLALEEYFKVVRPKMPKACIVTPVFGDWKNGQYKIISFYAKRAYGLMARYAIEHCITDPRKLKMFDVDGYTFVAADSDDKRWIFRRKLT